MNILIAAVGRLKSGPEAALYDDYVRRLPWSVELREIDLRKSRDAAEQKRLEAARLIAIVGDAAPLVALDERGDNLTSREFAERLAAWRDDGVRQIAFVIGGADGLEAALLTRATTKIAFGAATWPHLLARVMLAEQLYRASSILAGHPYHRD